ncbi:MAG: ABC transporter permease [Solirubrobacteraceae bacterium]|jgi:ribose transport system permease protein
MSTATDETPAGSNGERTPAGAPCRVPWRARNARLIEGAMLPAAFALLVLGFGIDSPNTFLTIGNFSNIFGSQAVLFVLTMALLVPLTNGDIDLSVGAISGLVTMIIAVLNVQDGIPIVYCCLIGLASGTLMGWVNGQIVIRFDVNPFIITLGTGYVFTGIGEWLSGEQTIVGVSPNLSNWTFTNQFLRIPLEFYYGLGVMLVLWYVLTFTPFGQRALFVGESREVARLSGFRVSSIRLQGFVIAGFIAAISGILYAGTNGSASPDTGTGLLLPAYAAAFLGLTTIQPGRFNAIGAGIALYFLATGVSGLELLGAQNYVQELFYGAVLVIAVVISRLVSRHRAAIKT